MQTLLSLWSTISLTPFLVQVEDGALILIQYKMGSMFYGILCSVYAHGYQSTGTVVIINEDTMVSKIGD